MLRRDPVGSPARRPWQWLRAAPWRARQASAGAHRSSTARRTHGPQALSPARAAHSRRSPRWKDQPESCASDNADRPGPRRSARSCNRPAAGCMPGYQGTSLSMHNDQVGFGDHGRGIVPEMHRMARRQRDHARMMADDRDRAAFGDPAERLDAGRVADGRGDDQRAFGGGNHFEQLPRSNADRDRAAAGRLRGGDDGRSGDRRRQRLTRQHQIDRAARSGHRHLIGARGDIGGLFRHAQFVIPFDQLAQHAGLVEHFLRPVDLAVARAEAAFLGDRGAAGGDDHRRAVAREIGDIVDGVGGADIDMHHHALRPPGHQIDAMRHRDREVLVRHQYRLAAAWHCFFWRARTPRQSAENRCPD